MDSRPPLEVGHDYQESGSLSPPHQPALSRHLSQRSRASWAAPSAPSFTEPLSPAPGLTLPPMSSLLEAVQSSEPKPLPWPPLGCHLSRLRAPELTPLSNPLLSRTWSSTNNISYQENPYRPQGRSTLPEMSMTLSSSSDPARSGFTFMTQPLRQSPEPPEPLGPLVQDQPTSPLEPLRSPHSPVGIPSPSSVVQTTMDYLPTCFNISTAWPLRPPPMHATPMSVVHPSSAPTLPPIPDNTGAPHTYLGALTLESTRGIPREAADRHFDPNADTKPRHETQRPLLPLTNTQQPLSPKSLASASLNQASAARQGTRGKTRKGQFVTRTRLYVSKACINCRNSKVACENARPCQRCVRLNKADTCVDAASKRRGRPGNVQFASSLLDPSDEASNAPVISSHSRAAGVSSAPLYRVSLPATRALSHCASALDAEPLASATSTMVLTSSAATSTAVPSTEPAKPASFKFRIKSVQHFNTGASRRADEDGFIHYLSTNSDAQTSASTLTRECITPASFPESTASFASGILRPSLASDANLSSYQHIHTTSTAGEPRTKFLLKTPESFESPYLRVARDDSSSLSASKATSHSHSFIQSRPLIFNCTTPANFNTDSGSAQSSPNLRPTKAARVKAILSRPTKESGGDKLRPQHVDHQSKAPSDHQAHATSPTLPRAGPMALSTITDPFNTDVRLVRRSSSADRPGPVSPQSNLAPRDSRSSPSSMPSEDEIDIAHFLLTNSQKHHTLPRP